MKVTFVGSGDAFGTGGRFNTCFLVQHGKGAFLIDCGASSLVAIRKLEVDPNLVDTIFVSHLHGDHFGGVPFFLLDAQFYSRRKTPLTLVGPRGFQARLTEALEVFFPGSSKTSPKFDLSVVEVDAGLEQTFGSVQLQPFLVSHECGAPPFALRLTCDGKIIAYSGDTEWTENLIAAARSADLFIAECLTFDKPIKFHMNYCALKPNLDRIRAQRVVLTHMGPDMLVHAPEGVELAHDGLVVEIP
jgi:ribonuclease BN (tRNA processing enzyme)